MRHNLPLLLAFLLGGCATVPPPQIPRVADAFPADAFITQRGVLTVFGGRQFTLNGYLATSATAGQRLVITENFGNVLADVLLRPDGRTQVMKSSRAFKPEWIERYIAEDVRCVFGSEPGADCPGKILGADHYLIERRWYKLDLKIVDVRTGVQPASMFEPQPPIKL